jgi:hypothetical protein
MQLPFSPTPTYSSIGYTDQKVIDSWERVIDTFNSSFPNHYLTNDFHPVNSGNLVADSVYEYAATQIGARYGANGWWWTQNNTSVYPSQYAILKNSSSVNQFTGIQMAYSGATSASSFGTGGMPAALNLAISQNICYWEIWNNDITSGIFDTLLSVATCIPLHITDEQAIHSEDDLTVSPNPSQGIFTISLNRNIEKIELINHLGQTIFIASEVYNKDFRLDISNRNEGLVFLRVTDVTKNIYCKKLVLLKE